MRFHLCNSSIYNTTRHTVAWRCQIKSLLLHLASHSNNSLIDKEPIKILTLDVYCVYGISLTINCVDRRFLIRHHITRITHILSHHWKCVYTIRKQVIKCSNKVRIKCKKGFYDWATSILIHSLCSISAYQHWSEIEITTWVVWCSFCMVIISEYQDRRISKQPSLIELRSEVVWFAYHKDIGVSTTVQLV